MNWKHALSWVGQAILIFVTFVLAVSIILIVTSGKKLDIPSEAFAVATPMFIVVLGYFLNKLILKNREETQKARDEMLEEIRSGINQVLEVTRACVPRQQREFLDHEGTR